MPQEESTNWNSTLQRLLQQQNDILQYLATQHAMNQQEVKNTDSGSSSLQVHVSIYHGRQDENLGSWLFQMEEAFLAKGVPDSRKVHNVSFYLGSAALQWYQNRKRNAEMHQAPHINTWEEFVSVIKEAFQPFNQ